MDQLRTDAYDELSGIGSRGLRYFAELVKSEASGRRSLPVVASHSVDIRPRCFHYEKVLQGGHTGSGKGEKHLLY